MVEKMVKVMIVGCGDLGGLVAKQLADLNIETVGVRRSAIAIDGVKIIQADVTQQASVDRLKEVQPEILIYCVAANGRNDEQYKSHYVDGLRHVLNTQVNNSHLKHVFFVSSTRVYGQKSEALINETIMAMPADFGGERLLEAENLLLSLPCNATTLRLSGIYGPGRLRMINLAKSPDSWPKENSWSNRIHRDDAAAFMVYLVQKVLTNDAVDNCYIVTDSEPTTQHEVLHWIAAQLGIAFSELAPVIEGGKRLCNQTMLATGFKLQYPDFRAGYQALLNQEADIQNTAIQNAKKVTSTKYV